MEKSNRSRVDGKKVLVPLDGSALAEKALPHAVALARGTASGVVLMRVVPPITLIEPMGAAFANSAGLWDLYDEQPALAGEYLHAVAERLASLEVEVATHVGEGIPGEVIVGYAQEHPEVAAIAMSTHGRSGLGRWLFGSVAEKVLHSSPVPLLLVRPEAERTEQEMPELVDLPRYRTLLVPLDGSPLAEQALEQAHALARGVGARLVLLSVATTPFDLKLVKRDAEAEWSAAPWDTAAAHLAGYLDRITGGLADAGVAVQAQVSYGDVADEILKAARSVEADLIVMATHGRGGLGHLMVGSVAMRVAQAATVPLLLVRATERDPASR
jgi:nucleotide-binding universal stress UspA family protein